MQSFPFFLYFHINLFLKNLLALEKNCIFTGDLVNGTYLRKTSPSLSITCRNSNSAAFAAQNYLAHIELSPWEYRQWQNACPVGKGHEFVTCNNRVFRIVCHSSKCDVRQLVTDRGKFYRWTSRDFRKGPSIALWNRCPFKIMTASIGISSCHRDIICTFV